MSDDPIEWLVKEFGADGGTNFVWITCNEDDAWLVEYHSDTHEWLIFGNYTAMPLTRADVARLMEIFGVEVKR